MASDIVEDFEGGTDGATISTSNTGLGFADGTATFTDANGVHTGTLAALYSATAGTSYSVVYFGSPTLRSASYMRWYVTFQALPASNTLIAALRAVTTVRAEVRMNAAGTVTLRNATTAVYTSSATLSAGTTYRFEWDAINSTGQQLRVYVGDSMTTVISSGNQTYNTGTHDRMSVGLYASATWTLQVDDIETRDDFNAGSMGSAVDADVTRAQSVAITTAAAATYPAAVARAQTLASSVTAVRGAVGAVAVAQTFAIATAAVVDHPTGATRPQTFGATVAAANAGVAAVPVAETFGIVIGTANAATGAVPIAESVAITPTAQRVAGVAQAVAQTFAITTAATRTATGAVAASEALGLAVGAVRGVIVGQAIGAALGTSITATAAAGVGVQRSQTFGISAAITVAHFVDVAVPLAVATTNAAVRTMLAAASVPALTVGASITAGRAVTAGAVIGELPTLYGSGVYGNDYGGGGLSVDMAITAGPLAAASVPLTVATTTTATRTVSPDLTAPIAVAMTISATRLALSEVAIGITAGTAMTAVRGAVAAAAVAAVLDETSTTSRAAAGNATVPSTFAVAAAAYTGVETVRSQTFAVNPSATRGVAAAADDLAETFAATIDAARGVLVDVAVGLALDTTQACDLTVHADLSEPLLFAAFTTGGRGLPVDAALSVAVVTSATIAAGPVGSVPVAAALTIAATATTTVSGALAPLVESVTMAPAAVVVRPADIDPFGAAFAAELEAMLTATGDELLASALDLSCSASVTDGSIRQPRATSRGRRLPTMTGV